MIKRPFYRLHELAVRWGCSKEDLLFLGGSGKARICYDVWGLAQKPSAVLTHLSESEVFARWPDLARQMLAREVTETAPIPAEYVRRIEKSLPNLIHWLVCQDFAKEWFHARFEPAVELRFEDLCMLRTEMERLDREVFGHSQTPAPPAAPAAIVETAASSPPRLDVCPALEKMAAANARWASEPSQAAKAQVRDRWEKWRRGELQFDNATHFAQTMVDEFEPVLTSVKNVASWCTTWKKEAARG